MQYYREISSNIAELVSEFTGIVVTGARQVGKTTLLKQLFPDHNYVSLDLPSTAEMANQNPDLFLKKYAPPLIVDEVQYAPELFRYLKIWIDQNRESKGQLILTGSQKFTLMKGITESLAGRIGFLELEPLSIHEINRGQKEFNKKIYNNLDLPNLMERGFYPELWKEKKRSFKYYYEGYLRTYLERDIRGIVNVNNLNDFEKFLRICASRSGQILNKSEIAKDVGVRMNTINSWISVLEASNQITLLNPFYENFGKRLVKSPKLYFNDVGLCLFLVGLDGESILESPMLGFAFETLVFNELTKQIKNDHNFNQLYFYRDNQDREVDFILLKKGKVHFIETKWSKKPEIRYAKKLEKISLDMKSKTYGLGDRIIISRVDDPYEIIPNVTAISIFDYISAH